MNDIKYLSEFLLFKKNKKKMQKKELNPNIFLNYWIEKNKDYNGRKLLNTIKSYQINNNEYNKLYQEYLNELKKNNYDIQYFDIVFESFFPRPNEFLDEKMFMYDYMMEQIEKKSNNSNRTKNNYNSNINISNMMNINMNKNKLKDLNIKIEEKDNQIYVSFYKNNTLYLNYLWGEKDLFNYFINQLNFNVQDFNNILLDIKPIENINYNLTNNDINILIEKCKKILRHYQLIGDQYEKKIRIDEKNNIELYNILKNISEKKNIDNNNNIFLNNKLIINEYNELFNINILFLLYNYIIDYIYLFLEFDNNIFLKIEKLNEYFKFINFISINKNFNFVKKFNKKTELYYTFGKKKYKNILTQNTYITFIFELFLLFYKLQLKFSISKNDLLLSILFHQYDYSIITNDKNNYFIRRDIENYYLIKSYIFNYLNCDNKNLIKKNIIEYEYPFFLRDRQFLNITYQLNLPYDLIYKDKSLIIKEDMNTLFKSSNNYLENVSLNKNLQILNYNNKKKIENHFYQMNIIKENEFLNKLHYNQIKGGFKKIKKNKNNSMYFNQYFNIYEEKYLNPIKDFKPSKYAYCSLYYGNNQYFLDTMLFGYSQYLSGTKNDRILFCTTDILLEQRKQLSRFYNRIFIVKPLDIDHLYFKGENRWYGVFNKLYAFYLDEYEKIFLMDTDMIIQKSEMKNKYDSFNTLDTMFEKLNTPCGLCYDKEYIFLTNKKISERLIEKYLYENKTVVSAGIFLIKPSKDIFFDILQKTNPNLNKDIKNTIRGSIFPEEAFLANYFKKQGIYSLGIEYSFTPIWTDKMDILGIKNKLENIKKEDIVVIHYVGYKNWIYLLESYWFIFDNNNYSSIIDKYKKLWCLLFFDLQDLCIKETYGLEVKKINSLINYCKWDKISFAN